MPSQSLPTFISRLLSVTTRCALLAWLLGFSASGLAGPAAFDLGMGYTGPQALIPHAVYWQDHSATQTYQDIEKTTHKFRETSAAETMNIGYSTAAHWFQFSLTNSSNKDQQRILTIEYPLLDEITLYHQQGGVLISQRQGRIQRAIEQTNNRTFAFSITLKPKQTVDYTLRVASQDAVVVPAKLMTERDYFKSQNHFNQIMAFYFGITVAIAIFGFFLWSYMREPLYRSYTLGIICHHILFFMFLNGYAPQALGLTDLWWSRESLTVTLSLSLMFLILFGRHLFNLEINHPKLSLFLNINLFLCVAGVVLAFSVSHFYAITIVSVCAAFSAATLFVIGTINLKTNPTIARFYLSAWGIVIFGGILYSLKTWALVPSNVITEFAWQFGAAIESILLTLALTIRIKDEAKQREDTQNEMLRLHLANNEMLEHRVLERTQELNALTQQLAAISDTDQLTQLKNRRFSDRVLPPEIRRLAEHGKPLALMMMDIDHFKAFNDNYGHIAGDECIKAVAATISAELHWPRDCAIRYGGEEFCAFLPETDEKGALAVAERIRQNIENLTFDIDGEIIRVTISIGIVAHPPSRDDTLTSLIKRADETLYAAKKSGRNRTLIYNPKVITFIQRPQKL